MSIKITKDDLTIEVDTEAELRLVLDNLGIKRQTVSIAPKTFVVDTAILSRLYSSIPSYTKSSEVLRILKQRPKGITQSELMKELGIDSAQALGGVFGGIGRKAKELGIFTDDVYQWKYVNGDDVYKLTDNMAEAMDKVTKQSDLSDLFA